MSNMENNCRTYRAIGKVDPKVIKNTYWDILDLSQAVFEINTEEPEVHGVVCHGRAMAFRPKKIEPLLDILSSVHAVKVILPFFRKGNPDGPKEKGEHCKDCIEPYYYDE